MKLKILILLLGIPSLCLSQKTDKPFHAIDIAAKESASYFNRNLRTSQAVNNYDMKYHRCQWYIDPNNYYISGSVTSYFVSKVPALNQAEFDFANTMTTDSVYYHGSLTTFSQSSDVLSVTLGSSPGIGVLDSVTVYYQGAPVATGFGSFDLNFHNSIPIISTLSEPYGAKDWWPCKQSLDDKIDSIDIIITTPSQYRAGTIGVLKSENINGANTTYHWQSHYPITAYLVGIAVTEYAVYSDYLPLSSSDTLEILNYVYPEDSATAVTQTPFIKNVIALYDSLFITYPFHEEKYGHCQWSWGGGEEHQTMSFVSDFTPGLIAHECAHQWFGDMVTCSSFQDVWLNEGFATYLEALTREFLISPSSWTNWKSSTRSDITSVSFGSVFCTDTTSVNRIFDWRLSYEKGAFLLHMLRWKLGDIAFFQSVRNYLNDPLLSYSYAQTADLKNHMENVSGLSLTNFFDQWYYNQGYPSYTVSWNVSGNNLTVKINQTQSHPSVAFFEMPVPVSFENGILDTTIVFDNTFNGQVFQTSIGFNPVSVTFDPDIWILSKNNNVVYDPALAVNPIEDGIEKIQLYPNPISDFLVVKNDDSGNRVELNIRNTLGQLMFSSYLNLSSGENRIQLPSLSSGVYFVTLSSKNFSLNRRIIRE